MADSDTDDPEDFDRTVGATACVLFALGSFFVGMLLGSAGGGRVSDVTDTGMRWMGEGIGAGIAQAACIEQRGEWRYDECRLKETN